MLFIPSAETIRRGATLLLSIFNFNNNGIDKNDFSPNQVTKIDKLSSVNSLVNFYSNPVINTNLPDPSVIKLADGSGWALVATSEFAVKSNTSKAFPAYFSKGNSVFNKLCQITFTEMTVNEGKMTCIICFIVSVAIAT